MAIKHFIFVGIGFLHWHGIWTGFGAHPTSSLLWQAEEDSPPSQILHLFSLKLSIAKLKREILSNVHSCMHLQCLQ